MTYRAEIEDNIVMPKFKTGRTAKPAWPWDKMTVGQSFIMNEVKLTTARWYCTQAKHAGHGKFYADEVSENGVVVIRAWRTK